MLLDIWIFADLAASSSSRICCSLLSNTCSRWLILYACSILTFSKPSMDFWPKNSSFFIRVYSDIELSLERYKTFSRIRESFSLRHLLWNSSNFSLRTLCFKQPVLKVPKITFFFLSNNLFCKESIFGAKFSIFLTIEDYDMIIARLFFLNIFRDVLLNLEAASEIFIRKKSPRAALNFKFWSRA